jgi:hypothetical protein
MLLTNYICLKAVAPYFYNTRIDIEIHKDQKL